MNRRGFLSSLLGLAAAPIAGVLSVKAPLDLGYLTSQWRGYTASTLALAEKELLAGFSATKYWYDKPTRTIKFRRYTPYEIYKAPGTSS